LNETPLKTKPMGKTQLQLKASEDNGLIDLTLPVKLFSWNVMGSNYCKLELDHTARIKSQLEFLQTIDADIIFLQEVDQHFRSAYDSHDLSKHFHTYSSDVTPYGQMILSKHATSYEVYSIGKNSDKKIVVLSLKIDGQTTYFANCHLQAGRYNTAQRASQVSKIVTLLKSKNPAGLNFILGDLNMDSEAELIEGYNDLCPENDRELYTFNHVANYITATQQSSHRFDRFYCSAKIDVDYDVMTHIVLSDHFPMTLVVNRV